MSLRLQLLAFGLVTLVLPWTGWRYVQEMEAALRAGLERSLTASATTVAAALEEQRLPLCAGSGCAAPAALRGEPVYAAPLRSAPGVDGVRDDWDAAAAPAVELGPGRQLWAGTHGRFAYFFVAIDDEDLVYQRLPGEMPYGDRLVLALPAAALDGRWLLLVTAAPGVFRAQETAPARFESTGRYDDRVLAAWQETAAGYAVETRVPLTLLGESFGVAVIDVDRAGADFTVQTSATWDLARGRPGRFVRQHPALQSLLTQFGRAGGRFRVLDPDGFVIADAGSVEPAGSPEQQSLLGGLLRLALQREDPPYPPEQPPGRVSAPALLRALSGEAATAWYGGGSERDAIVAAAVPVAGAGGLTGAVLLEQASEPVLTLTNAALARLMSITLIATLLAAAGLLGYATWLSLRVRRLSLAAESAVGPKGEIEAHMPGRDAPDELGDLARAFSRLLERLREHTEYLRTLRSKLSHELRTPLAVVSTSLDNLEQEIGAAAAPDYLARLRQGANRLDAILGAMSEAAELEHAIKETAAEPFDAAAVAAACAGAYADVYPQRQIVYRGARSGALVTGSGELIAQALDKLIDNAVSFSAEGSRIEVSLEETAHGFLLSVVNEGPPLPEKMRGRLFDSLVSVREHGDGRPHLGLGLHIVALIAEFHGGAVTAEDVLGHGVAVRMLLPGRAASA